MNSRSFSLVEVLVASLIFSLAAAGIFATIKLTGQSSVADSRVKAALFGKKILDGLSTAVTTDTALNAALSSGSPHDVDEDPDYPGYSASYTVTPMADGTRKVTVTVGIPGS